MSERTFIQNNTPCGAALTVPFSHRWVAGVKAEDPDYFKRLASIHTPEHLFIGCSDARLSVQSMLVR